MVITHPKNNRSIPPDQEVIDTVKVFCRKCGFDLDKVNLTHIGGRRSDTFASQGVKLLHANQFTVQMYIGCRSEAVETHFKLIGENGRAINGNDLFQQIRQILGGSRLFLVTDAMIKECKRVVNGNVRLKEESAVTDPNTPARVEEPRPPVESAVVVDAPVVSNIASSTTSPEHPIVPVVYRRYFDDPANLHLAVCALVTICNEETTYLLSFSQFVGMLNEIGVPKSAGLPALLINVFTSRDFIKRFNPGSEPSRFVITTKAIEFARAPVPNAFVETTRKQSGHSPRSKNTSKQASDSRIDLREKLVRLKASAEEYKRLQEMLSSAQKKLEGFQKFDIGAEETATKGTIKSLEKKLGELKEYLLDLDRRRKEASKIDVEIVALTRSINDPGTLSELAELEEIRKLLA